MVGNILCAKAILLILYGRKVYEISVRRQDSRNLAVLSQFTSKSLQPSLQTIGTSRTGTVYTTDLDGNQVQTSFAPNLFLKAFSFSFVYSGLAVP